MCLVNLIPTFGTWHLHLVVLLSAVAQFQKKRLFYFHYLLENAIICKTQNLTEPQLRTCAIQGSEGSRSMEVIIDGVKLKNLENYRVQSPLFDVTFHENNIFSVKPGTTKAVSD